VTRHVAEEARKVSGTDSLFIPEPQKPKSAKENKNKSAGGDKVYEFTSVQLKGLVVAIAQHGSAVPRDFLVNLADAERLRKECAEWYTVLQLGTPEGDASHGFFSNVLGEIFDLLKPHCKDWRLPTGTSIVDPKTTTVTNIFDVLHIEYPPEIPDVPEWITKTKSNKKTRTSYRPKFAKQQMQLYVVAFLVECETLRTHASEQWILYGDGKISLQTASEVQNGAMYLIRSLEETIHERLGSTQKGAQVQRQFDQHSDLLAFLQERWQKVKPESVQADQCARMSDILEHCFTKPLEGHDPKELGTPLAFLSDPVLHLDNDEKAFLFVAACLWAMTAHHEIETTDGSLAFKQEAEYGTRSTNLLPSIMIPMRSSRKVTTSTVYSLQMIMDAQKFSRLKAR
jgi:hypothetical protein